MESQNPSGCNEDQFPGIAFQTKNALPQESQILYSWHGLPWPTSKQNALSPGLDLDIYVDISVPASLKDVGTNNHGRYAIVFIFLNK